MGIDSSTKQEDIEIVVCNGHICAVFDPNNIVLDLCKEAGVGMLPPQEEGQGKISLGDLGEFPVCFHDCLQINGGKKRPPVDAECLGIGCLLSNPNVCVRGPKGDIAVHNVTSLEQITGAVRQQLAVSNSNGGAEGT